MSKNVASLFQINLVILALPVAWLGFSYINRVSGEPWGALRVVFVFILIIASIIFGEVINSIFHETGHLLGGLLSGYSFVYFGCFGFVWIKEDGKLVRKRSNIKGRGGVSRLSPPDMKDGTFPFRLYYFSGFFMNLLLAGICALLFFPSAGFFSPWAIICLIIGLKAVIDFIMNLVPFNIDNVWNDGYVLFNLGKEKNADARLKHWRNLRVLAFIVQGNRPRDIPEEYFKWANINNKIEDPFVFEAGLIKYKYLMDREEFDSAKKHLETILNNLGSSLNHSRPFLNLELIFHELIGKRREGNIKELDTKEMKEYIKTTALTESTQRISYAYARLFARDDNLANQHLRLFNIACANSVNLGSIPGEKELIKFVDQLAASDY
jgi:hypothetical protein